MRKEALRRIAELVEADARIVFIGSDLGSGVMEEAMASHPDRVLMEGIAEQHVIGMASGLALEGFVPYVHTIATFLTRRALEQIIVDAALHSLPVRLIATGGGMVYAPLGPTHQAIDDFALMRAIPGMTIVAPIDPLEMVESIAALADWPGPAYVRVAKGGEPVVTEPGFFLGQIRVLREGSSCLVITTGAVGQEVLTAASIAASQGIDTMVVHVPTVAPLDELALLDLMANFTGILVVEEHLPNGGLWTSIVETVMRSKLHRNIHQASLPNRYAQEYGSQMDHWNACGLSSEQLVLRILSLAGGTTRG